MSRLRRWQRTENSETEKRNENGNVGGIQVGKKYNKCKNNRSPTDVKKFMKKQSTRFLSFSCFPPRVPPHSYSIPTLTHWRLCPDLVRAAPEESYLRWLHCLLPVLLPSDRHSLCHCFTNQPQNSDSVITLIVPFLHARCGRKMSSVSECVYLRSRIKKGEILNVKNVTLKLWWAEKT